MIEEIKEILDYIDDRIIPNEKWYKIKDYIINLQQENEKLKYNARGQVNDYFKDKYADEVLKSAELKKENEKLRFENGNLKTNEQINIEVHNKQLEIIKDYKSRCEKAIEYIKPIVTEKEDEKYYSITWYCKDVLLGMLNGK